MSSPSPFGQASTGGKTSNPFANASSSNANVQSSLFGTTSGASTSTKPQSFINTSATSAGSIFSQAAGSTQSASGGAGNIFGGNSKPTSPAFNFGPASQGGGTTSADMSNFSTPNKTSEPSTTGQGQAGKLFGEGTHIGGGGLFGNSNVAEASTPQGKLNSGFSLANSTTPAGPPPSNSGAVGNTSSLFKTSKPLSFGPTASAQSTTQDVRTSAAPAGALGGFSLASGGIFGTKKPAESDTLNSNSSPNANMFAKLSSAETSVPGTTTSSAMSNTAIQQTSTTATKPPSFFPPPGGNSLFSGPSQRSPQSVSTPSLFPLATASQAGPTNTITSSSSGSSVPHPATTSSGLFSNQNPTKAITLDLGTTPAASSGGGQKSLPAASANLSVFGSQLPTKTSGPTSSTAQTTTSKASDTPANQGAGLGTSTAGPAPPAQSRLKNKSMDEIITRWASDLSIYQKEFQKQAEQVSIWDRMLVENSDKIQKLYGSTLEAERATTEVERQLTAVENDQAELQIWLEHYERELSQMMSSQVGPGESLQGPDQERDKTYKLAEKISERLDEMGKDLGEMIEEINSASSALNKNSRSDDPLSQVIKVLNSHLFQLQEIDQGTAALQAKINAAQKTGQNVRSSNGFNGPISDAADGFYRSYLGRR